MMLVIKRPSNTANRIYSPIGETTNVKLSRKLDFHPALTSQSEMRWTAASINLLVVDVDVAVVFVVQDTLGLPELGVMPVVVSTDNVQGEGKGAVAEE